MTENKPEVIVHLCQDDAHLLDMMLAENHAQLMVMAQKITEDTAILTAAEKARGLKQTAELAEQLQRILTAVREGTVQ